MHKTWCSILNSSKKKNRSDTRLKPGQVQGQAEGDVVHCLCQLHTASCCVSQRVGLNVVGTGQLCCACRWVRLEDVWWKHLGDAALPSFFSAEFSGSDVMPPPGALYEVCSVLDFKCYICYQQPVMWWPCLLWQLCTDFENKAWFCFNGKPWKSVLDEGEQRVKICLGVKVVQNALFRV